MSRRDTWSLSTLPQTLQLHAAAVQQLAEANRARADLADPSYRARALAVAPLRRRRPVNVWRR